MDQGYRENAPGLVKCPNGLLADPLARVRSRQEMVNERFKNWEILNALYGHNIFKHQIVFGAIVCLTQLLLRDNPLFSVEYNDLQVLEYHLCDNCLLFYNQKLVLNK